MEITENRKYELHYMLPPELSEEDVLALVKKIEGYILENSGIIQESKLPKMEVFAYPVSKKTKGFRGQIIFEMLKGEFLEIKKKLKLEKNILRYGIIRIIPISQKELLKKEQRIQKSLSRSAEIKEKTEKLAEIPSAKKEEKINLEEIDKKLEEILGM